MKLSSFIGKQIGNTIRGHIKNDIMEAKKAERQRLWEEKQDMENSTFLKIFNNEIECYRDSIMYQDWMQVIMDESEGQRRRTRYY